MSAGYSQITRSFLTLVMVGGIFLATQHNDTLSQRVIDEWQMNPHTAVRDADYDLSKLLASMEKRVMIGTFGTDASQLEHDLEVLRYQLALTQTDSYRMRFADIPEALNVLDDTSQEVEQLQNRIMGLRPGDVDEFARLQESLLGHRDDLTQLVDHSQDWAQRRLADLKRDRNLWTMLQYGLTGLCGLLALTGLIPARRRSATASHHTANDMTVCLHEMTDTALASPANQLQAEEEGPVYTMAPTAGNNRRALFSRPRHDQSTMLINAPPTLAPRPTTPGPISPVPTDIAASIDQIMGEISPWLQHRGISLAAMIDPDTPAQIDAIPGHIETILRHLVGNAVKFTDQGGIVITADLSTPAGHDVPMLRLSVLDTGIGIEPGYRDMIFGPQVQVDPDQAVDFSAFDPAQTGQGNGLATIRQIVHAAGGQSGVESKPGLGSRFWVTLPCETDAHGIGHVLDARHHHILIVDSDPIRSEAIADQFQAFGADVTMAEHAFAAVESIMLHQRHHRGSFDLMLITAPYGIQAVLPLLRQLQQIDTPPRHLALAMPRDMIPADQDWAQHLSSHCHILSMPLPCREIYGLAHHVFTPEQVYAQKTIRTA